MLTVAVPVVSVTAMVPAASADASVVPTYTEHWTDWLGVGLSVSVELDATPLTSSAGETVTDVGYTNGSTRYDPRSRVTVNVDFGAVNSTATGQSPIPDPLRLFQSMEVR